jgi:hypothetical protein
MIVFNPPPQSATIPLGNKPPSVRVLQMLASSTFSAHPESWKTNKQQKTTKRKETK